MQKTKLSIETICKSTLHHVFCVFLVIVLLFFVVFFKYIFYHLFRDHTGEMTLIWSRNSTHCYHLNFLYSALVRGRAGRCSFWPVQGEQLGASVGRAGRLRTTWWAVCSNLEDPGWALWRPAPAAAAAACYWAWEGGTVRGAGGSWGSVGVAAGLPLPRPSRAPLLDEGPWKKLLQPGKWQETRGYNNVTMEQLWKGAQKPHPKKKNHRQISDLDNEVKTTIKPEGLAPAMLQQNNFTDKVKHLPHPRFSDLTPQRAMKWSQ